MKALKYFGNWNIDLVETPIPSCVGPKDVIVQIKATGICGTDIGIATGDYPVATPGVTLGHETSGVVADVGADAAAFRVGDRVVVDPTYACGHCRRCRTGRANHCTQKNGTEAGVSYDGAFAHYYRTTEPFLLKLKDHVSFEEASLTEPLSCVLTGIDALNTCHLSYRCVVIGSGPMGLLYALGLSLKGLSVCVIENNAHRQVFARQCLESSGLSVFPDVATAAAELYGAADAELDICIDTSGKLLPSLLMQIAPGGKILLVALKSGQYKLDVLQIADKSISILGSIDSLNNSFQSAHHIIETGKISVNQLISHRFSLEEYRRGFGILGCNLEAQRPSPINEPCCKVILHTGHML